MRIVLFCVLASLACADFNFPDFTPASIAAQQAQIQQAPLQFLKFNGSDPQFFPMFDIRPSGALILSSNESQQAYAMWYSQQQYVVEGFVATFSWTVTEKEIDGGDGVAFVVQSEGLGGPNNIKPLGAAGKGMGYSGIPYSVAVEFDMYLDPDQADPNANHISAHSRGESPNNADERPLDIRGSLLQSDPAIQINPLGDPAGQMDEGTHIAQLSYIVSPNPALTRIEVNIDGRVQPALTVRVDIGSLLKLVDGYAYIGMTSSTGDSSQLHEIHNWTFVGEPTITQLIPSAGPETGMTYVQVMGANYKNYSTIECFFDMDTATNLPNPASVVPGTYVTTDRIDCIAPPHIPATTQFTLSFINNKPLKKNLPYFYYPPPNITNSVPLGGPTTGYTNVTVFGIGFIPFLLPITTCMVGDFVVPAVNMTNATVLCSPTPPINDSAVGMRKFDVSMNAQQYTGQARDFYYYHPFNIQRFKPRGGFIAGGDHITMQGNFTMTPELTCNFGGTSLNASIDQPMYYKDGVPFMTCIAPPHTSGFFPLEVSGNNQQWTNLGYIYIYDANLWIWLTAGIVGLLALLMVCMCGQCFAMMWRFKDYRLLASKEYREMTGKSAIEAMRDLVAAKDAEERRKIIQVLNMLKMKKKANQPKFNQTSRWGSAAARALSQERANKMTGWDALLLGTHKPAPGDAPAPAAAAARGGGTVTKGGPSTASDSSASSGPDTRKPAPGAAWGAIIRMSKEGGGGAAAGASPAGKSGWAKLATAPKAFDKKETQPLL